jgi:hypothetical protein
MSPQELIAYCRTTRQGKPEGDIRSPAVMRDVLTMLLEDHMARLPASVQRETSGVYDSLNGRVVRAAPDPPPPDPKNDATARELATLIGYLEDL